ncbi:Cof-type HAD-IIB family hydrolase [Vagococcus fluvialis]|uniref:HAD family phosphatase n=2 Tax=Vagococcus fluvialis TaxID=2738 RepID=A0A7X6DA00_9ENTE|nr:HAD family phosphatase [Vagococcus fluvialis]
MKAIVLDIDGTLLTSEKKLSKLTKASLLKAQKQGVKVILASGRPTTGMLDLAEELELAKYDGYLVSYNGSKVIDVKTGEELFNQAMTVEEGKAVLEHMKQFDVTVMIDKDDYMYTNDVFSCTLDYKGQPLNIVEYESRGGKYKLCEKDDLAEFLDYPINKILTAGKPEYLQEVYQEMKAPFNNQLNCVFTADFYFEFTAQDIDKAKALYTVLSPLGIERKDVIAFGDGHNDITMLAYAGMGVAMENAVSELKRVADFETNSNDEESIANFLEQHLFN